MSCGYTKPSQRQSKEITAAALSASARFLIAALLKMQHDSQYSKECSSISAKLVEQLIMVANAPSLAVDVRVSRLWHPNFRSRRQTQRQALHYMNECLRNFPTSFKGKHAESVTQLAFQNLCGQEDLREEGRELLAQLYLAAKNKQASIETWTQTVEQLVVHAEHCIQDITTTFSEGKQSAFAGLFY
jgi:hypothetical protein